MLVKHYDPAYMKSLDKNYGGDASRLTFSLTGVDRRDFDTLSEKILESLPLANES
jgi:hypothetical protein